MRDPAALLLILAILLCPAVCCAERIDHGPDGSVCCSGTGDRPAPPDPCPPDDVEDCVCQGAVQSDTHRVEAPDAAGLPCPIPAPCGLGGSRPSAHPTRDGSPAGRATSGGASAVRSYLQNFRC